MERGLLKHSVMWSEDGNTADVSRFEHSKFSWKTESCFQEQRDYVRVRGHDKCVIACQDSSNTQYLFTFWPCTHSHRHTPAPPSPSCYFPQLYIAVKAAADVALIFFCNECVSLSLHPAVKPSPEMVLWTWVRGPVNRLVFPHRPSRLPSGRPQALSAQARPPISSAMTRNQSPKLAGNMRWGCWVDQWGALGLWEPWCMVWLHIHTSDSHWTPPFTSIIAKPQGSYVYSGLAVPDHMNNIWLRKLSDICC